MKYANAKKLIKNMANVARIADNPLDYIYVLKSGVCTTRKPGPEHDSFKIRAGFTMQIDRHDDIAFQLIRFFKRVGE